MATGPCPLALAVGCATASTAGVAGSTVAAGAASTAAVPPERVATHAALCTDTARATGSHSATAAWKSHLPGGRLRAVGTGQRSHRGVIYPDRATVAAFG